MTILVALVMILIANVHWLSGSTFASILSPRRRGDSRLTNQRVIVPFCKVIVLSMLMMLIVRIVKTRVCCVRS